MLARTPHSLVYLSAEELGITERERAGLIEVRDDLASGRVKHAVMNDDAEHCSVATVFNMAYWTTRTDCGTAHCIGGYLFMRGQSTMWGHSDSLGSLFYPRGAGDNDAWDLLTADQAVRAIDLFLSGAANQCWPMAIADLPLADIPLA